MEMLKILIAFAAGCGCGVVATRVYFDKQYRKLADEEIESVKEVFKLRVEDIPVKKEEPERPVITDGDKKMYSKITRIYSEDNLKNEHPKDDEPLDPYQITSMEYFDDSKYDKQNLTYYASNDVLVNAGETEDTGEIIDDANAVIGEDNIHILLNGFDDGSAMYVRNSRLGVDFEITKTYSDYI